jgi:hypothetical protein
LNGSRTEFQVDNIQGVPKKVILDKYGQLCQANSAAFSIFSFRREPEQTLIVYGSVDERPTNREAAEGLQKAIRESGSNHTVAIRADKDVNDNDIKGHHLILIGRPDSNLLVERFRESLPVRFGKRSFVVRGKTYAHPGSSVIAAADNPLDKTRSLVVVSGLSAEATVHAPRRYMDQQSAGEVVVLPNAGQALSIVVPGRDCVRDVHLEKEPATENRP